MFYAPSELQPIIKSLTASEKAYFKKFSGADKTANYILLFDYLDKNENSAEKDILKFFEKKKKSVKVHALCNYLYEQLMMALYHAEIQRDGFSNHVYANNFAMDFLMRKANFAAAKKIADRGCETANEQNMLFMRQQFEYRQYNLSIILSPQMPRHEIRAWTSKRLDTIEELHWQTMFIGSNVLLYDYYRQSSSYEQEKFIEQSNRVHEDIKSFDVQAKPWSAATKCLYYEYMETYYKYRREDEHSKKLLSDELTFYQTEETFRIRYQAKYLNFLWQYIQFLNLLCDETGIAELLNTVEEVKPSNDFELRFKDMIVLYAEMILLRYAPHLLNNTEQAIVHAQSNFLREPNYLLSYSYSMQCLMYFFMKQNRWDEAAVLLEKLKDTKIKCHDFGHYMSIEFFEFGYHYHLKNYELLASLSMSLDRQINGKGKYLQSEKKFCLMVKYISENATDENKCQAYMQNTLKELKELFNRDYNKAKRPVFDAVQWVEEQIKQRT